LHRLNWRLNEHEHNGVDMIFSRQTIEQMRKYIITGVISFGSEYAIMYILTSFFHIWHITSNTIAILIVFWVNFFLNKYWSFKSDKKLVKQLILYLLLFAFNLGASNVIMYCFTDIWGVSYLISKVISTGMIVSWNFIIYKKVIYK
jgi:putative flippase GtrA